MSSSQSAVSGDSRAEELMPAVHSVNPLSVSSTFPEVPALCVTSFELAPLHHAPPGDLQVRPRHQGNEHAVVPRTIISTARQTTIDQCAISVHEMTGTADAKALAAAIGNTFCEVLEKLEKQTYFGDWPMLDEIKEKINGTLSNDLLMHFVGFDTDLGICYSKLTKALDEYDHYLTSVESASSEINAEKMSRGKEILQGFADIDEKISSLGWDLQTKMDHSVDNVLISIQEYKNNIESELKSGWKCQQTIKADKEWVEVVAQPAIPEASDPVSAAVNIWGNTAMLGARLDYQEQSELIAIRREMYEQEKLKAIELEQSVVESQIKIRELSSIWEDGKDILGLDKLFGITQRTFQVMSSADTLTFFKIRVGMFQVKEIIGAIKIPTQELIVRLTPYYKPGIHVVREVKNFSRYVPDIVRCVNLLLSAKKIICYGYEDDFERVVLDLCAAISHQIEEMKNIYGKWITSIKPERQDTFRRQTGAFGTLFQCQIEKLRENLEAHSSQEKSQQATIERDESDRYYKNCSWEGRPVAGCGEALDALRRVKRCGLAVYHLSVLCATARDEGLTNRDWPQPKELPNETLHKCNPPQSALPNVLSTVSSALDNIIVSRGRKAVTKKPREQAAPIGLFTRLRRGIFTFKGT